MRILIMGKERSGDEWRYLQENGVFRRETSRDEECLITTKHGEASSL